MRALARYRVRGHQLLDLTCGLSTVMHTFKYSDAYLMVNGSSGEGIHNVMRALSKPCTARVTITRARPLCADHNGREKAVREEKALMVMRLKISRLRCINAEQLNTITQLRRTQDPAK